ncbi:MAG: hypothetical protein ACI4WY_01835 [Anaerovoracaceae bacterium]
MQNKKERRMHQGDRWRIGAFFGAYLQLNVQMVQGGFLGITVASAGVLLFMAAQLSSSTSVTILFSPFAGVLSSLLPLACAAGAFAGIIHVMIKLDSQMLYQKSAYLYQSVPVSAFETALAKTAVGAAAMMIPVILFLLTKLCMAAFYETAALALYRQMEEAGLPLEYPAASMLLMVLSLLSGSMTASGIVLLGFGLGNQLRENRDRKPKMLFCTVAILIMEAGLWGISWLLRNMPGVGGMAASGIHFAVFVFLTCLLLQANTWILEEKYIV